MHKTGIVVVCLAILAAGLLYVKQGTKNDSSIPAHVSGSDPINFSTWQMFRPRSGLFEVLLPHSPQYAKDFVPIPGSELMRRYDMYASEKIDGTLFLISVITYPKEGENTEFSDILKQTVDELMRTKPDNKLSKQKESVFNGLRSMDFTMVNREFNVEGKVFMTDHIVYVLSYVTRKGEFNNVEYQHFIDSFKLLDNQMSSVPAS
jgi:hypothetical protein